jgi:hypothetical protein
MEISTTPDGIIIFRWESQDQSEIDQWFFDLNTRYHQANPPTSYHMIHILVQGFG